MHKSEFAKAVLFENDDALALDKPSGLLVVCDRWDKNEKTLTEWVRLYSQAQVWPVHRLDRDASGVVLFAKHAQMRNFLEKQFSTRQVNPVRDRVPTSRRDSVSNGVKKLYDVLVEGEMEQDQGTIDLALSEDLKNPGRMRAGGKRAKAAITRYEVSERFKGLTHLEVMTLTGRQHQIRVHLAAVGHSVICDPWYGSSRPYYLSEMKRHYKRKANEPERPLMNRLALHAREISFLTQDGTGQTVAAPLPKDFTVFLKYLRKFWK